MKRLEQSLALSKYWINISSLPTPVGKKAVKHGSILQFLSSSLKEAQTPVPRSL